MWIYFTHKHACTPPLPPHTQSQLMPNEEGPRHSRQLLFSSLVTSILIYGAALWKVAHLSRCPMVSIYHRLAQQIISTFQTVSYELSSMCRSLDATNSSLEDIGAFKPTNIGLRWTIKQSIQGAHRQMIAQSMCSSSISVFRKKDKF